MLSKRKKDLFSELVKQLVAKNMMHLVKRVFCSINNIKLVNYFHY